jgi:hypothetical protein
MNLSNRNILLFLLLSFALKIIVALLVGQPLISDMAVYRALSQSIFVGNGLANSYWPPGYPYFLAGIYFIFGENLLIVAIIQALLSTATGLLLYLAVKRVAPLRVAQVSLLFFLFFIDSALYATFLYTQTLFVFLTVIIFWLAMLDEDKPRLWHKIMLGAVAGLAAYVKTVIFLPLLFLGLWSVFHRRRQKLTTFLSWVLAAFVISAVLAPLTIYLYQTTGHFVIVHSNTGINLYIGNNPDSSGGYYLKENPSMLNIPEGMDYYQADHYFMGKALRFIRDNPGLELANLLKKMVRLVSLRGAYVPLLFSPHPPALVISIGILSILSIALLWFLLTFELCFAPRIFPGESASLSLITGLFIALIIFFVGAAYIYLASPFMIIIASWGFVRLFRLGDAKDGIHPTFTLRRWIIFAALWALIIFSWVWEIINRSDYLLSIWKSLFQ